MGGEPHHAPLRLHSPRTSSSSSSSQPPRAQVATEAYADTKARIAEEEADVHLTADLGGQKALDKSKIAANRCAAIAIAASTPSKASGMEQQQQDCPRCKCKRMGQQTTARHSAHDAAHGGNVPCSFGATGASYAATSRPTPSSEAASACIASTTRARWTRFPAVRRFSSQMLTESCRLAQSTMIPTRALPDASVACPNGTVPMALAAHAQMEKLKESTQAKLQVRPHLSSCVTLPFPENSCCFQPCAALLSALNAPLLHGTSLLTVVSPLPSPAAARDGGDAALARRGGAAERDRRGEDRLGRHHVHRPCEVCRNSSLREASPPSRARTMPQSSWKPSPAD